MARITPLSLEQAPEGSLGEWKRQVEMFGRMTNMKRTLARSPAALSTYMDWYPLRDQVAGFLGDRATLVFTHAVSSESDCLICSTYFRKGLADMGEDPDVLELDDKEQSLVEFARQLSRTPFRVEDAVYDRVRTFVNEDQMLLLTAFGGLMVATNIVNNVLDVDLDDYLESYRGGGQQ